MLAGRKDLEYVSNLLPRMKDFSDDGETLQGAYGYRWRHQFHIDQIELVVQELENNPESRRAVIQMWSANDLGRVSKDLPCNTQLYVNVRQDYVDMTVCCRSNDAKFSLTFNLLIVWTDIVYELQIIHSCEPLSTI